MKVLVCGGRDFSESQYMEQVLNMLQLTSTDEIWHGGASGADELAGMYGAKWNVPVRAFPADWKQHGRAAGPIRNAEMLAAGPDLVVAFWDGASRGTEDMIGRARRGRCNVMIFFYTPEPRKEPIARTGA